MSGWDAALIACYMQRMRIDMADCSAIYKAINLMSLSHANATSLTGVVTHTPNTHSHHGHGECDLISDSREIK